MNDVSTLPRPPPLYLQGVLALVTGLRSNRGLLVLDLEYKSVSSGEGLGALLETHPTLTVRHRLGEGGEGRGQGVSVMLPCFFSIWLVPPPPRRPSSCETYWYHYYMY